MYRLLFLLLALGLGACETPLQRPDKDFDASVAQPAFPKAPHPVLLFDAGHHNFHTVDGLYDGFARLAANDGFDVQPVAKMITVDALSGARLLVVAGARGEGDRNELAAFTATETAAIDAWVRSGGALLLVADHYPFGPAVAPLAARFGVRLAPGMVEDSLQFDRPSGDHSQLLFTRGKGLLADSAFSAGVAQVVSFTGTALWGSPDAWKVLGLSPTAYTLQPEVTVQKDGGDTRVTINYGHPEPATGGAQCLALQAGKGRVVVLGEAALLSAQLNRDGGKVGMNANAGNKQFALNLLRWLAGR